jgi:pyruvate/2-oxoglutarate dehydrogenase complex dihydrolipoamide dehydrogenase (E3) component
LRDFKNYLIRQIEKSPVVVKLNTEATVEMLDSNRYDVVLAALGAEPIVPPIPGVENKNVVYAADVYGKEDTLEKDVVIIGGGEIGLETGLHLAEIGHRVTLLEMQARLAAQATPVHYYSMFMEAVNKQKNLKCILEATCVRIDKDAVTYIDTEGARHEIKAGSVVVAVGMKARIGRAMELSAAGNTFYMIGDCNKAGNVQKAMRSAFSIASMI